MNPQLRLHDFSSSFSSAETTERNERPQYADPAHDAREWVSAFNTSILTTRATETAVRGPDLSAIMQTPEFKSLILAAQSLSESLGISKEEATERMIVAFRNLDSAWTQLVMRRGLQAMLDR
jgi:hypothetical protein